MLTGTLDLRKGGLPGWNWLSYMSPLRAQCSLQPEAEEKSDIQNTGRIPHTVTGLEVKGSSSRECQHSLVTASWREKGDLSPTTARE